MFGSRATTLSVVRLQLLLACQRLVVKCANFLPLEEWRFSQFREYLYFPLYRNRLSNTSVIAQLAARRLKVEWLKVEGYNLQPASSAP
ncbi:MAG TPA: hypothetical protein V6D11_24965 [Waterburya sp.]